MTLLRLAALLVSLTPLALTAPGDPARPFKPEEARALSEQALAEQTRLRKSFLAWRASAEQQIQRLEADTRSDESKAKAAVVKKALDKARTSRIEQKFDAILTALKEPRLETLDDLAKRTKPQGELAGILREVAAILLTDYRDESQRRRNKEFVGRVHDLRRISRRIEEWSQRTNDRKVPIATLVKEQTELMTALRELAAALGKDVGQAEEEGKAAAKHLEDASRSLERAGIRLRAEDRGAAAPDQAAASTALAEAVTQLLVILERRREEERGYRLEGLSARLRRLHSTQAELHQGILDLDKSVRANADGKPAPRDRQRAAALGEQQQKLVREIEKAVVLVEAEGAAVAFPEVLRQVRDDIVVVRRRLARIDTGVVTQAVSKDVVETLDEMVHALKFRNDVARRLPLRQPAQDPLADLVEEMLDIASAEMSLFELFQALSR